MLSKQFKEIAKYALFRGGILASMAVITFLYPSFLTGGMVYAIAAYVILNALLGIMRYMQNKGNEKNRAFYLCLFLSSLSILFGILPVFLGLILIIEGVVHFIETLNVESKLKAVMIVLSISAAVGGIILIIFTFGFGNIKALSQMFGSLLVLSCLEELLIRLSCQQNIKSTGGAAK